MSMMYKTVLSIAQQYPDAELWTTTRVADIATWITNLVTQSHVKNFLTILNFKFKLTVAVSLYKYHKLWPILTCSRKLLLLLLVKDGGLGLCRDNVSNLGIVCSTSLMKHETSARHRASRGVKQSNLDIVIIGLGNGFAYLSMLPWNFPGAPLKINGAPGNIQANFTALVSPTLKVKPEDEDEICGPFTHTT